MNTECTSGQLEFQGLGRRKIVVKNDASIHSSDAGFLLLSNLEMKHKIIDSLVEIPVKSATHSGLNRPPHSVENIVPPTSVKSLLFGGFSCRKTPLHSTS